MHGILSALPSTLHSRFRPPSVAPFPVAAPERALARPSSLVGDHLNLLEPYTRQPTKRQEQQAEMQQERPRFRLLVAKLPPGTTPLQLTKPLEEAFPRSVGSVKIPPSKHGKRQRNFAIVDLYYKVDLSRAREACRRARLAVEMKAVNVEELV